MRCNTPGHLLRDCTAEVNYFCEDWSEELEDGQFPDVDGYQNEDKYQINAISIEMREREKTDDPCPAREKAERLHC